MDKSRLRMAGLLLTGSGVMLLLTVVHVFVVLPTSGWRIEMFDRPEDLLPWMHENGGLHQGLWMIYFASQTLLLAVPWLIRKPSGTQVSAVVGTTSVIISMAGLAVLYAAGPPVARAFVEAGSIGGRHAAVALHEALSDVGKDLRLFSELFLGAWLIWLAHRATRMSGHLTFWLLGCVGLWTIFVALVKLVNPYSPLEDSLGFVLGIAFATIGVAFVRMANRLSEFSLALSRHPRR